MRRWNDQAEWVIGEDGLRWYFTESDPGGPSRLECYRRLLAEPADVKRPDGMTRLILAADSAVATAVRHWEDVLELAKRAWRGHPVIQHEIAGQ